MDNIKPAALVTMAGGVLLLISTFLDWAGFGPIGWSAYDGDLFGLNGIFMLIIALVAIAIPAIQNFAPAVNLPARVMGLSLNELTMMLGFAALVYTFSLWFWSPSQSGVILAAIGAAAIDVGAWMGIKDAR